jgi:hypothetical protein
VVRVLDQEDVQRLAGLADATAVVREAVAALDTRLAEDQDASRNLPLGEC